MSLEELRKRATAAELTLIDAVVAEVKREARSEVKNEIFKYIDLSFPPSRESARDFVGQAKVWVARLDEHLALNLK